MKNRKITLASLTIMFLLSSGCGLKERVVQIKDNLKRDKTSEKDSSANNASNSELTGMLLNLDPEKCPIIGGCGPEFSLLGRTLKSQIALEGDINSEHAGLILTVSGSAVALDSSLTNKTGYEKIKSTFQVDDYRLRSKIPYHSLLVEGATEYTTKEFGCDLHWDKSFSWTISNKIPQLMVKMTNTFSNDSPQPFVELTFNGNNGDLINVTHSADDLQPCSI